MLFKFVPGGFSCLINYNNLYSNWKKIWNYLDFCEFCTPQSGLDFVPKLPPLPSFSNHEIANSSLDTIECQLKIRKIFVSLGALFSSQGIHTLALGHCIHSHLTKMCKKEKCIKLMAIYINYMVIGNCSLESKMWGNYSF